ncbi:MAG: PQQ-dependent sugar dehydrogenase [Candidatus Liptonbacteria bacterium]|nr:PQQ-dependent sugar dehydrogenase [Candidatus Liptonbacteria bacterium]
MRNAILAAAIAFALLGAGLAASFYFSHLRGIGPAIMPPPGDITKVIEAGGIPLTLPRGFSVSIFAKDLPGARVMAFDSFGNMWVSQTSEGTVSLLEIDKESGAVQSQNAVFLDLKNPHGLAFAPDNVFLLYIAEEDKVSRVGTYSEDTLHKIIDLPSGKGHFTRTIKFGPDKKLYVSIGSSCNVCNEGDERRAKIFTADEDGSNFREFARGLRNTVFFDWDAQGRMWGTDMGRDLIGDDIPPDEVNIIEEGKNYGWPICYGKNIHDADFDKNTYIRNPCMEPFETPSFMDLPAHVAPLGFVFIPESPAWPNEYWNDLLVAYHGSWNRSEPVGYKVVHFDMDEVDRTLDGGFPSEDFISGWLTSEGALGRPVDLVIGPDKALYVSDDKAGVIYRVGRKSE